MATSANQKNKKQIILLMVFICFTYFSVHGMNVKTDSHQVNNLIKKSEMLEYYWEFGDSSYSHEKKPKHIYSKAGKYNVLLIVTNGNGCSDSMRKTVEIFPNPVADFSGKNICSGNHASFMDLSTIENGNLSSYSWNFGDGNLSQSINPENKYEQEGTYSVTQIVSSEKGCIDTIVKNIEVYSLPTVRIFANDICIGDSINFKSEVHISTGSVTKYNWNFGDGNTSSQIAPVYIYKAALAYPVSLQIESDRGCNTTTTTQIKVYALPEIDFLADNLTACGSLDVQFQNYSELKNRLEYNWNFGDGTFSTQENPTHNYAQYGYYDVTLSAKNQEGCTNQMVKNKYLQVYPVPSADFTLSKESVMLSNPDFKILNISSNAISWNWNFGDGSVENTQNPNHNYSDTGIFVINLNVFNAYGCEDTISRTIRVKAQTFIYVPTAFTPNGDGLNDQFKPTGIDLFKKYEIMVFNRWGKKIFESNDFSYGWDGTYNGAPVQDGGYTFMIVLVDFKGKDQLLSGTVTVLR